MEVSVGGGLVNQVRFRGQGCAVSMACASMLCEGVEGRAVAEVLAKTAEELMDFEVGQLSGWKQRCALLGWEALRMALLTGREIETKPVPEVGPMSGDDAGGPLSLDVPA